MGRFWNGYCLVSLRRIEGVRERPTWVPDVAVVETRSTTLRLEKKFYFWGGHVCARAMPGSARRVPTCLFLSAALSACAQLFDTENDVILSPLLLLPFLFSSLLLYSDVWNSLS